MRESWWHKSYGEQGLNVQQTHTPPRLSHTKQWEQAKALISILAAPGNELRIKILHDTRPQSWAQHAVKTKHKTLARTHGHIWALRTRQEIKNLLKLPINHRGSEMRT